MCNGYKGAQLEGIDPVTGEKQQLFNPRTQEWDEHFQWDESGTKIEGVTACGRATVQALQLNNLLAVSVRRAWVQAGWHP